MPGLNQPGATSGQQVQISLGEMVRNVHVALARAQQGVEFLANNSDADLLRDFQINAQDARALRDAFTELSDLYRTYRGERPQPEPRNFHARAARVYGLGFQ